jgi:hypothetical protein
VDIYIIIFLALAVFILLRLRSVLGRRTGSERPFRVSAFAYRLSMIAAVLCAVHYVAYEANWYSALEARVTPVTNISGLARVVDGDTVIVAGILLAMALLLGTALVLSFLHWRDWKAQKPEQGDGLKKAKPLDGLQRDHPSQRKADDPPLSHQKAQRVDPGLLHQNAQKVDPRIEREFNNVFMTTSKDGKQALFKRWMDKKKCDREEAMRLAIEELRWDNR